MRAKRWKRHAVAYTFVVHERFVEVRLSGILESPERLLPHELHELLRTRAVLYDYTDVTDIRHDPWAISDTVRRVAAQGVRIAGCTPRLEWFGAARQVSLLAGIEGPNSRLFRTREEAVAWLIHPELWSAK